MQEKWRVMIKVLFVCLGNICRSPLAEGLFRARVGEAGLDDKFVIDSAGTDSYHAGQPPDERMRALAAERGIKLDCTARNLRKDDLLEFDYVIAMDQSNRERITRVHERIDNATSRIFLMRAFDPVGNADAEVPDPYYGDNADFETVYEILDRSTQNLLSFVVKEHYL